MWERKKQEMELKDCTFKPNIWKARKSKSPVPYPMDVRTQIDTESQGGQTQGGSDLNNSIGSMMRTLDQPHKNMDYVTLMEKEEIH